MPRQLTPILNLVLIVSTIAILFNPSAAQVGYGNGNGVGLNGLGLDGLLQGLTNVAGVGGGAAGNQQQQQQQANNNALGLGELPTTNN